jgi:hypothetical protein
MTSSYLAAGPGPATALLRAGGSPAVWAAALILAAALGGRAARAVRAARLHWSWPALFAGTALLARGGLGGLGLVIAAVGTRAAVIGRRWHREDLGASAAASRRARARVTPVDAAGGLARRVRACAPRPAGARLRAGRLAIGRDERGRAVEIPLAGDCERHGARRAGRHTLVVGATGSGKTVTQSDRLGGDRARARRDRHRPQGRRRAAPRSAARRSRRRTAAARVVAAG